MPQVLELMSNLGPDYSMIARGIGMACHLVYPDAQWRILNRRKFPLHGVRKVNIYPDTESANSQ